MIKRVDGRLGATAFAGGRLLRLPVVGGPAGPAVRRPRRVAVAVVGRRHASPRQLVLPPGRDQPNAPPQPPPHARQSPSLFLFFLFLTYGQPNRPSLFDCFPFFSSSYRIAISRLATSGHHVKVLYTLSIKSVRDWFSKCKHRWSNGTIFFCHWPSTRWFQRPTKSTLSISSSFFLFFFIVPYRNFTTCNFRSPCQGLLYSSY